MPPELPNEQELTLKKRARRRLVGAIALVLLMVIVLPQVLQDRALLAQQEAIKITMPEAAVESHAKVNAAVSPVDMADTQSSSNNAAAIADNQQAEPDAVPEPVIEKPAVEKAPETKKTEVKANPEPAAEKALPVKVAEVKKPEVKKPEAPATVAEPEKKSSTVAPEVKEGQKSSETFAVQVGVYSDMANVKRLQDQLKQAGFTTHTEKIKTPKGESVRLKAGSYASRQEAVAALAKVKEIGLSGIVVGNE